MRIALFSEVYWPMVSGVGVTLLRLTDALQARGHAVRVYSATYALPDGPAGPAGGPPLAQRARSSSIPTSSGPSPGCATWSRTWPRFRPDVVHVATEFSLGIAGLKAARQLGIPIIASAHTDYDQYAARYGVPWALRAGWHYLRWFYGQAHRVLCPSRIYEEHLHTPRRAAHRDLEPRRRSRGRSRPGSGATAYRAALRPAGRTTCW